MKRKKERRLFYDSADTISDDVYIKFLALSALHENTTLNGNTLAGSTSFSLE
ncbi:MAG: hypothetical protein ACJ71P_15380 [Nitrososphaeraceae archaeon]|jgi:hypothetical protein